VKRRAFITLLGGAAMAAWPLAVRAQQAAVPVVGFLHTGAPEQGAPSVAGFRKGLNDGGFVEGRNVMVEYRWAYFDRGRLPELAIELVRRQVAVLATPGNLSAALAAKAATTTIPIVFSSAGDPVRAGLVASFNRPGGNVTGATGMNMQLGGKRFGLLHELLPNAQRFAMLTSPTNPNAEFLVQEARAAAETIGRPIEVLNVTTSREIDSTFASLAEKRIEGLSVTADAFLDSRRIQIVALAVRHAIPAIYAIRAGAAAGGLMSYGPQQGEAERQAGIYTARILKGEKPADLPIIRASKFEFVINLQAARTIGIEVPPLLAARADEIIE
jgi:putative ABC transport system substrate-binding protein